MAWYDVDGFNPWTGSAGGTYFYGDLWRFALDWDLAPYDTLLSLQNRVTIDTVSATVTRVIPWKTEVPASAAYLVGRNENETGQPRTNPGQRYELGLSRRLYMKDETTRPAGLLRLGYLGYRYDLDVGVYDPRRQTVEEIGLDGRWAFRPRWETFGTAMVGAQQEKGEGGSPTYALETGVDREIGAAGRVTLGAFVADSAAAGRGGGYRRTGGYLRFRIPFWQDRLIFPMLNESMAVLREQVVDDADLLDAAVIFGTGFAPFRGGPIRYARERGVDSVIARLEQLEQRYGSRFHPDPG